MGTSWGVRMKIVVVGMCVVVAAAACLLLRPGAGTAALPSCPTSYVDQVDCTNPTSTTTVTTTVTANPNATVNVARTDQIPTKCLIAPAVRSARLAVVDDTVTIRGGEVHAKFHKVGTPGRDKLKVTVASYAGPITKRLTPGTWHGTFIYLPVKGSAASYCGVKFSIKVKGKKPRHHRHAVKIPHSVTSGLRHSTP